MKQEFFNHIAREFPYLKDKKLLLATSGGLDSMVMVDLFHQLSFEIKMAHCNFQLRGDESLEDENFVLNYSKTNAIGLIICRFDTLKFAKDHKFSIQEAARELRYNWFFELLETENFDYILTAHHADDNLETFLIHLSRGTGLEGLTGIPVKNDKVIRPLLPFSREKIATYAKEQNLVWREDSSNASDSYLRNKIRHHLVPILKELNPDFLTSFSKTQKYLKQSQALVEDAAIIVYQKIARAKGNEIHFDLEKLDKIPHYDAYLYQWLYEYGFTAWNDIYDLVYAQTGKQIFSESHRLLKDRKFLILAPITETKEESIVFYVQEKDKKIRNPLALSFQNVKKIKVGLVSTIFVDKDRLKFPLTIRKWKEGDVFQPFGMGGKSKKLSKFFKDEKLSLLEKEAIWLLCSDEEIVWVINYRQDERFRVNDSTQNILKIGF